MKRLLLIAVLAVSLILAGCTNQTKPSPTPNPTLIVTPSSIPVTPTSTLTTGDYSISDMLLKQTDVPETKLVDKGVETYEETIALYPNLKENLTKAEQIEYAWIVLGINIIGGGRLSVMDTVVLSKSEKGAIWSYQDEKEKFENLAKKNNYEIRQIEDKLGDEQFIIIAKKDMGFGVTQTDYIIVFRKGTRQRQLDITDWNYGFTFDKVLELAKIASDRMPTN
jgi:hypothetical protein